MNIPVFYRTYLEYLLQHIESLGLNSVQATYGCSFPATSLPSSISDNDLQCILNNIETQLKFNAFQVGFNLGFQLSAADHGTVGLASLCSETVAESLQTYSDYFQIISPVFKLTCYEEKQYFVSEAICEGVISPSTYDFLIALGLANGGLIGLNIIDYDPHVHREKVIIEVGNFPKPNKALWELFSPLANISYGHASTKLKIPLAVSKQKLSTANSNTRLAILKLCDIELENNQKDFIYLVRKKIKEQLEEPLHAEHMARLFAMSERSFHRKLKKLNTSYGKLCLEIKLQEAKLLLSKKEKSIKEIAYDLGYSEVTNVSSAFKRSEGLSPKQYQKILD